MNKPMTATDVRMRQIEFCQRPDVIKACEAFGRFQGKVLSVLIDRVKEICQNKARNQPEA